MKKIYVLARAGSYPYPNIIGVFSSKKRIKDYLGYVYPEHSFQDAVDGYGYQIKEYVTNELSTFVDGCLEIRNSTK